MAEFNLYPSTETQAGPDANFDSVKQTATNAASAVSEHASDFWNRFKSFLTPSDKKAVPTKEVDTATQPPAPVEQARVELVKGATPAVPEQSTPAVIKSADKSSVSPEGQGNGFESVKASANSAAVAVKTFFQGFGDKLSKLFTPTVSPSVVADTLAASSDKSVVAPAAKNAVSAVVPDAAIAHRVESPAVVKKRPLEINVIAGSNTSKDITPPNLSREQVVEAHSTDLTAYNTLLKTHNTLVSTYETELAIYNKELALYNAEMASLKWKVGEDKDGNLSFSIDMKGEKDGKDAQVLLDRYNDLQKKAQSLQKQMVGLQDQKSQLDTSYAQVNTRHQALENTRVAFNSGEMQFASTGGFSFGTTTA